jgi:hypothetical protein
MHISIPSEDEILLDIPGSLEEVKLLLASKPIVLRPSDRAFEEWEYRVIVARNPYSGEVFGIMLDVLYKSENIVWGVILYRQDELGDYHQHSETGVDAYEHWIRLLTTP